MSSITSEEETTNAHSLGAALMHLVRTNIGDVVLIWFRLTRQNLLEAHRQTLFVLCLGKAGYVPVAHAPHAVLCNFGSHVPVFGMDDEVDILVAKPFEVVIDLSGSLP